MWKSPWIVVIGLEVLSLAACTRGPRASGSVVNLAIWSNYLPAGVVAEFEKRTGVRVQISNYSSNEELLAKLQAGASGYDVVVPSDYMVFAMIKLGLLLPLNPAQLPNMKNLDPRFLRKNFDPENRYSVPYDWGTTGIAVSRALYRGEIRGWKDFFGKPDLSGKISILDDAREAIGAALKAQGFSLNSKDPAELGKARALLLQARSRFKLFTSEPLMPLVNGEVAVAHAYSSDALQARRRTQGKIEYLIPEEGATWWIDNLVIPVGAPHLKEAHALINDLLEGKVNATTVMSVFVSPANRDALALLPKSLQSDPALFPPEKILSRCEMMEDLGAALPLWDRIWTEVKAARD